MATPFQTSNTAWSPDESTHMAEKILPSALLLSTATKSGVVEGDAPSVRVGFLVDQEASFVDEGGLITESGFDPSEIVIHTSKLAEITAVTYEQKYQSDTMSALKASFERSMTIAADKAYINQPVPVNPAVTPPAGLLNTPGLTVGEDVTGNLDALIDLLAELRTNYADPTHILLSPAAWATLRKFKIADSYNSSLLGAGTQDSQPYLFDVPVIVSSALPGNWGMVLDQTEILSVYSGIRVAVTEDYLFNYDTTALRMTWRIGWGIPRPDRIGKFKVVTDDPTA
jgi:HK97 family phage major capsid protein